MLQCRCVNPQSNFSSHRYIFLAQILFYLVNGLLYYFHSYLCLSSSHILSLSHWLIIYFSLSSKTKIESIHSLSIMLKCKKQNHPETLKRSQKTPSNSSTKPISLNQFPHWKPLKTTAPLQHHLRQCTTIVQACKTANLPPFLVTCHDHTIT